MQVYFYTCARFTPLTPLKPTVYQDELRAAREYQHKGRGFCTLRHCATIGFGLVFRLYFRKKSTRYMQPAVIMIMLVIRVLWICGGNNFSTSTNTLIAIIQIRFITPPTNNKPISNQQHPRQYPPWAKLFFYWCDVEILLTQIIVCLVLTRSIAV